MKTECMVVKCDRCGVEVRLERLDGGGTNIIKYAHLDSDWTRIEGKDLCPCCSDVYANMIKDFMNPIVKRHD